MEKCRPQYEVAVWQQKEKYCRYVLDCHELVTSLVNILKQNFQGFSMHVYGDIFVDDARRHETRYFVCDLVISMELPIHNYHDLVSFLD